MHQEAINSQNPAWPRPHREVANRVQRSLLSRFRFRQRWTRRRHARDQERVAMTIRARLFLGLVMFSISSCNIREIDTAQRAQSTPGMSITLTPSASTYGFNKVAQGIVGFHAVIKNEGTEAVTIAHPSMCSPRDNFRPGHTRHVADNHGQSEILLTITKPDGTTALLRDGWMHGFDPHNVYHFTIPSGGRQSFYLGWFFQNARGRWENDGEAATVFLDKGTYKVKLIFRNTFPWALIFNKDSNRVAVEQVWTGEMQSEEVAITIE
jgi:hypothetical protein